MWLAIKATDRQHLIVWYSTKRRQWLVSPAVNGCVTNFPWVFDTWREAVDHAFSEVSA